MRTFVVTLLMLASCAEEASSYEPGEEFAGGETTVFETGGTAFSLVWILHILKVA